MGKEQDYFGINKASKFFSDNPNAVHMDGFSAQKASRLFSFYLQETCDDETLPRERMRFEKVLDESNLANAEFSGVRVTREEFEVVKDGLLAAKAARNQMTLELE